MQLEKFDRAPPTIKSYDNKRSGHLTGGAEGVTCSPPLKFRKKYFFSGNYHAKFGYFVNFSYIYFRAKMSYPQS